MLLLSLLANVIATLSTTPVAIVVTFNSDADSQHQHPQLLLDEASSTSISVTGPATKGNETTAAADPTLMLSVATLHPENGTVNTVFPGFAAFGGGMTGGCNTAYNKGTRGSNPNRPNILPTFYKIVATGGPGSSTGSLLEISPVTGKVVKNTTLSGAVVQAPGEETFLAGPDTNGLLYTAAPLSYTSYTIFSYDVGSGAVKEVATLPKEQLDGIGVCVGFIGDEADPTGLYYIVADNLVRFDTVKLTVDPKPVTTYFTAPLAADPAHVGSILTITEDGPASVDGRKGSSSSSSSSSNAPPTTVLARVDLKTGDKTVLYAWNATFYKHLCYCSLPIRPQDQADLTVSADGKTVWVVLSYNDKPNKKHESLLTAGMFVLSVGATSAELVSTAEAWSENDAVQKPHISTMEFYLHEQEHQEQGKGQEQA